MTVTIPTFPTGDFDIDFGSNNEVNFAVLESVFGDGYIQRTADGLNSNRDTWNATWTNLTDAESALIFAFLRARGGYQPFYYQAPGDGVLKQWTARDVKRKPTGYAYWQISATLKQEFGSTIEVKYIHMITGVGAVGSAGRIAGPAPVVLLIGVAGIGRYGTITPSRLKIVGVSATGSAGSILGGNVRLNGVTATGIADTVTTSTNSAVIGNLPTVAATGSAGTIRGSDSIELFGVAGTGNAGTVTAVIT